ncbi:MAG: ATP-binding protein [Bryobacteraceae bacterium]
MTGLKWGEEREARQSAIRRIPRSLRFRLAFSYMVFFAIVLIGIGFLFRQTLAHTLESHSHDILDEEYASVKAYVRFEHDIPLWFADKDDPEEAAFVARLRRIILMADANGRVLEASDGYLALGLESADEIKRILAAGKTDWTVRRNSRGVAFLIRRSVLVDEKKVHFCAIARAISEDVAITNEFTLKYLALVPLLLILASVMGWFFAGPALQPLIAVAGTAQRISGSNLALRITPRGAGDELDHLIGTFNSMMDRLDGSFQQSQQFSADVSHELRTPLTVIRGQLEVALFTAQDVEGYRDAIVNALQGVERLSHIIKTLLLLSQAEAGHLILQRTHLDLGSLVEDMVEEFQIPAIEAQITLTATVESPCFVSADKLQIERLLTNLFSNAIKYTHPGGSVRAVVKALDGWGELTVEDSGIGIPEGHLPQIFDRFFRVPNADVLAERGIGLGLSFVAWVVKAHGGSIDVESELGKGSRFRVRLPASASEPEIADQARQPAQTPAPRYS